MIGKNIQGKVENCYLLDLIGEGKFGKVFLACEDFKYDWHTRN